MVMAKKPELVQFIIRRVGKVLASRVSGHHLDTHPLKDHSSGHPQAPKICEEFLNFKYVKEFVIPRSFYGHCALFHRVNTW